MGEIGERLAQGGTAEIFAYGADAVLKLYLPGVAAGEAEREAAKAFAAFAAGVRTPAVRAVVTVNGRRGVVFERVTEPPLIRRLFADRQNAAAGFTLMARLHADLHAHTDFNQKRGFPSLLTRLEYQIQSAKLPPKSEAFALRRLNELCADSEENALCHGDFHPLNILTASDNPADAILIDWADACAGPPLADVARSCLLLRHAELPDTLPESERDWLNRERAALTEVYVNAYHAQRPFGGAAFAAWLPVVAAARCADRIPASEREAMQTLCAYP